jgi:glucose-1-phosphate thymidylyltransferase
MFSGYTLHMRGILLAGGTGTRLSPITRAVNKHLIPIYDKPMVYYPLTTLILAGVREICLVSTGNGVAQFESILGNGSQWGLDISYVVQDKAAGIAHGIDVALQSYSVPESCIVILGDNIFYGLGLGRSIAEIVGGDSSVIWTQEVDKPESFGIVRINESGEILSFVEKPQEGFGNLAITGLYYFPVDLVTIIGSTQKSARGEHEITEILNSYLASKRIKTEYLSRGVYWLDAGTIENLLEAAQFVRVVQTRQGQLIGSPDEAAWRMGHISDQGFEDLVDKMSDSEYKKQLLKVISGR